MKPTAFALEVAQAARDTTARIQALRVRPTLTVSGTLRLGSLTSIQSDLLPYVLRSLRDEHPALEVSVAPLNDTPDLLDALAAGKLERGCTGAPRKADPPG